MKRDSQGRFRQPTIGERLTESLLRAIAWTLRSADRYAWPGYQRPFRLYLVTTKGQRIPLTGRAGFDDPRGLDSALELADRLATGLHTGDHILIDTVSV